MKKLAAFVLLLGFLLVTTFINKSQVDAEVINVAKYASHVEGYRYGVRSVISTMTLKEWLSCRMDKELAQSNPDRPSFTAWFKDGSSVEIKIMEMR